jgi:hypothetical protein
MESLIGGASLRGVAERPIAAPQPKAVAEASRRAVSAQTFRDNVRAAKTAILTRKQSAERNAKLERTRRSRLSLQSG